jgi:hypothetical protein
LRKTNNKNFIALIHTTNCTQSGSLFAENEGYANRYIK